MENFPYSVTDELSDDPKTCFFGMVLNRFTNIAHNAPRPHRADSQVQTFPCDVYQFLRLLIDFANCESFAVVPMHPIQKDGHVAIDDVAFSKRTVIWNAVANNFVDRRAK